MKWTKRNGDCEDSALSSAVFLARPCLRRVAFLVLIVAVMALTGCAGSQRKRDSRDVDVRPGRVDGPPLREGSGMQPARRGIPDPLRPMNEVFFTFNEKLYFWVLRPTATGYRAVVPESARSRVGNFFNNIAAPVRVVNCLLQGNIKGTGVETGRFGINTTVGVLGFGDPASSWGLEEREEDFDQTLGVYGVGQGIYLVLPIFGPSSLRGVVGKVGDYFADPLTYYPHDIWLKGGIRTYDLVNKTSLRIEDLDEIWDQLAPYASMKDGYRQIRESLVKENRSESIFISSQSSEDSGQGE